VSDVSEVKVLSVPVRMGPMTVMAYVLVGDRVVVVDTGVGGQADRILARIAEEGREAADVSLILLTHGHGDHAGSAAALREATGAPIALGSGDEEKCVAGVDREMHGRGVAGRMLLNMIRRRQTKGGPTGGGPTADIAIDTEFPLAPYGIDAVAVPMPGHTRGSLAVFTGSGDALVGDLIGGAGRSRGEPKRGIFVSDEDAMDASIRAVIARAPRLTYTGHDAQPFTLEQLRAAFAGN
jgi:glyoxylase-like metal-dependent hydrolase (beta-lactamase superfamily II)